MERKDWCWYLVVDEEGNIEEGFNSKIAAEDWAEEYGGEVLKVKEVEQGRSL